MSLKEYFQITLPAKESAGKDWVEWESQRVDRGAPRDGDKFNTLASIEIECNGYVPESAHGFGGDTDITNNVSGAIRKGYKRDALKNTDDQYNGEHMDLFYVTAKDEDGNEGVLERNNYMDRL